MTRLVLVICVAIASPQTVADHAGAAEAGLAAQCAQAGNDDTVRPYDPALRYELLKAYQRLFPHARVPPNEQAFQAGSHIRCMDGHLRACFTGANLPCAKMNAAPENRGADAFCRSNAQAEIVPAFAAGHDSVYAYRCVSGRAEIAGETFSLDPRGFAAALWTPID
jgi:hypothetical protein